MEDKKIYPAVGSFALVFVLLSLIWKIDWAPIAGLSIIAVCLLIPPLALLVAKGWYAFADLLGRINSFVLMSVLFWLVVVPIGYMRKLFGKPKAVTGTTFKDVNKTYTAADFEKPW